MDITEASEASVLGSNPSEHDLIYRMIKPAFFFITLTLTNPLFVASDSTMFFHGSKIWRVSNQGQFETLQGEFSLREEINHQGTTAPVPSPNQRYIAFTQNNDMWIWDLRTDTKIQATRHGKKENENGIAVFVLITAWADDNKKVLYSVAHSETYGLENESEEPVVPRASYGYRIYDLDKKSSQPIRLPGEFEAWLPNGDFVLISPEPELFDQRLLLYQPEQELPQLITSYKGAWGQVDASDDGRWLVAALSQGDSGVAASDEERQLASKIIKIDLKNNSSTDITPMGSWSEYQLPKFSPDGKHIAYIRQGEPDSSGYARGVLMADGKTVSPALPLPFQYYWINDERIVVSAEDQFVVYDLEENRALSQVEPSR